MYFIHFIFFTSILVLKPYNIDGGSSAESKKSDTVLVSKNTYQNEAEADAELRKILENATKNQQQIFKDFEPIKRSKNDLERTKNAGQMLQNVLECRENDVKIGKKMRKSSKNKRFAVVGVKKERNLLEKTGHVYKLTIHYMAAPTGVVGGAIGALCYAALGCFRYAKRECRTLGGIWRHTVAGFMVGLVDGYGIIELPLTGFRPSNDYKEFRNDRDEAINDLIRGRDWGRRTTRLY